jgi:centrosomal protein CEP41|tara:strand:+ start:5854 stop:6702 length:849 start_codon:yes stop_codon:yes gene_type:complete
MSKMMRTSTSSVRSDPIKKGFEVRVPERRRFQHVGSKLDTGATARSVRYLTNSQVLRRRDETFRRISRDDLAELFEEYEKVDDERLDTLGLGLDGGCGPVIASYAADDNEEYERPYLVLDVRDPAAFARCHVLQARSMPQRLLMQDRAQPDLYRFRNREGRLIVLYDDDERMAAAAAHQLVHRGFDNVYVLTRGIVGFHNAYPHYVEGDPGALPRPPASPAKKKSSGYGRSGGRGRVVRRSGASYGYNQRADAGSPDKLSRMSELSVADSVISRATTRKSRY